MTALNSEFAHIEHHKVTSNSFINQAPPSPVVVVGDNQRRFMLNSLFKVEYDTDACLNFGNAVLKEPTRSFFTSDDQQKGVGVIGKRKKSRKGGSFANNRMKKIR